MAGIDDVIAQMMKDEYEDAEQLKPIQYAKLRGLYPQRVYKAIRDRKLEVISCLCGSKVINVDAADKVFKVGKHRAGPQGTLASLQAEEEVPGSDLDADDTDS